MRREAPTGRREEAHPSLERIDVSQPVGTLRGVLLERLQQFVEEVMLTLTTRISETMAGD
jgi:hypothetical protein